MRTLLFLLAFALVARAQMHPSLPEPGTLDGLGVNIHFTEPQPGELEMVRAAGFRWVRMDFSWAATEPEPGRYDFAKYDALLAALEKAGLHAYFSLDYGHPHYADAGDKHPFTSRAGTQDFRDAFAKWAVAAVGHFKGRGIVWELWNEPNISGFWKPKPDVEQYIALAKTVAAALEKAGLRTKSRNFAPATKREAAGECLVGPATSVIDLPFLDACFAAGLLEVFDAISVHPYRQGAPESVAEEYRALRLLIRRHCAADALPLGTNDPSRPNPARRIPILSGEWGYSTAWPSLGKDEAAREATQAKYLPRMFLTNVANDIPLSIWYDWRDDGDDPKEAGHRFGIVRRKPTADGKQPFEPKPAYTATKVMYEKLSGHRYRNGVYVKGQDTVLAWWNQSGTRPLPIAGEFEAFDANGAKANVPAGISDSLHVDMPDSVTYLRAASGNPGLEIAATAVDLPLEFVGTAPFHFPVRAKIKNPIKRSIGYDVLIFRDSLDDFSWQCLGSGPEPAKELRADQVVEVKQDISITSRVGSNDLHVMIPIGLQPPPPVAQGIVTPDTGIRFNPRVIVLNPIHFRLLPTRKEELLVEVLNPTGQPFDGEIGTAVIAISPGGKRTERIGLQPFTLARNETRTLVQLLLPEITSKEDESVRYGALVLRDRHGSRLWMLGSMPTPAEIEARKLTLHTDGDGAVASTQSLADGQPAEGASVSGTPSVGLRYRFGAGWKFVRIEPKDAAARKIEGEPRAFGIWVHGDGQGGTPCIRLRDATGQVHQVRGEPVSWKGWRYVTFPLRPAADSGQTMIPLPDAGAEQRVTWSHWGGANDGEVHLPIEWDSLFLLDGNRQAMEGGIFLSAPTLVY